MGELSALANGLDVKDKGSSGFYSELLSDMVGP